MTFFIILFWENSETMANSVININYEGNSTGKASEKCEIKLPHTSAEFWF